MQFNQVNQNQGVVNNAIDYDVAILQAATSIYCSWMATENFGRLNQLDSQLISDCRDLIRKRIPKGTE